MQYQPEPPTHGVDSNPIHRVRLMKVSHHHYTLLRWRFSMAFATAFLTLLASAATAAEPTAFQFESDEGGVWVLEGDTKVLRYQRDAKSLQGKFTRANYVHPLLDLDGNELTEDFPADHPHQRGIFWAWHQITIGDRAIGDSWALKDFTWDVREVQQQAHADHATLNSLVDWKSPQWLDDTGKERPFVREETAIRVHRAQQGGRAIDFEIRLLALAEGVKIGGSEDEKGYGGFSPRLRLPADVKFQGEKGAIEPAAGAVQAGPWVDVSGSYGASDVVSGVTMLAHPSLPVFPPVWVLRRQRSMQNAVYPGREAVLLPTDRPLVLRYRLVVHRGTVTAEQAGRWQKKYANDAPASEIK